MKVKYFFCLISFFLTSAVFAGTSSSYKITTETLDAGRANADHKVMVENYHVYGKIIP